MRKFAGIASYSEISSLLFQCVSLGSRTVRDIGARNDPKSRVTDLQGKPDI